MLLRAVDDRVHHLLNGLVLQGNADDAGVTVASALHLQVHHMIVRLVRDRAPASHPIGGSRQILQRPRQTGNDRAVSISQRFELSAGPLQIDIENHGVLIVDRHPGIGRQILFHSVARIDHPERKNKTREAMMLMSFHGGALRRVHGAELRLGDVDARRLVHDAVGRWIIRIHPAAVDVARMQKSEMGCVDIAFDRLQPIAFPVGERDVSVVGLVWHDRVNLRKRRRHRALAHVDEHQPALLAGLVGGCRHAGRILVLVGKVRLIDTVAVDIELPAVIGAAKPVVLVASQKQRRAPVRAAVIEYSHPAAGVAEGDQLLAEQH
jgi:hypothetical protein